MGLRMSLNVKQGPTGWVESHTREGKFDRPIFIIAPPRSGSTFLFECLTHYVGLYYLKQEGDSVWWQIFPYEQMDDPSDYVGGTGATPDAVQQIRKLIYGKAVRSRAARISRRTRLFRVLWHLLTGRRIRYIDKTIANCFHLDFLERAFPDAQYVFLIRDPRANISSMIEGWPHIQLVGKPQLAPILAALDQSTVEHWSYPAPPGWQEIVSRSLPEICAWSWQQHVEYALNFFQERPGDVTWIRYEDLVENTWSTVNGLAQYLGLESKDSTQRAVLEHPTSRTAISKPYQGKWREIHQQEILSILPMIRETASRIGYEL
jgi:hypothetical protein